MESWKNVTSENVPLFFSVWGHLIFKFKQTQHKHGTSDIAACHSPNMQCTTSLRHHHWLWCIIMTVHVRERYLKRRKDERGFFLSQEGEKRDTSTDGAEKETRVFVCEPEASFPFLADIKHQQTSSVPQIQPSEPSAKQQAWQWWCSSIPR